MINPKLKTVNCQILKSETAISYEEQSQIINLKSQIFAPSALLCVLCDIPHPRSIFSYI